MKPYLAFQYDFYYPQGGMNDFVGAFDTLDEAKAALDGIRADVHQILCPDGKVLDRGRVDWSDTYGEWTEQKPV